MKQEKPRDDFPLFPHRNGQWAKKIKGKLFYFGKWENPVEAERKYLRDKPFLELGVEAPKPQKLVVVAKTTKGMRIVDGINLFLTDAKRRMQSKDLGVRSFKDLKSTAGRILEAIDRESIIDEIPPSEWAKVKKRFGKGTNATTVSSEITRAKIIINWLVKNGHISRQPNFGTSFDKPSKAKQRIAKQSASRRWFNAFEVRQLLTHAKQPLQSMIALGVNCGFGNGDCSRLEARWIDLEGGWVEFPRPKTGVERRAKLWPETVYLLKTWIEARPESSSPLLFITRHGNRWSNPDSADCAITKAFLKLCKDLDCHIHGRGFYGLRRTCETVGGESRDQVAVDFVMGHIDQSMAGTYRQAISDQRLEAVAETIRRWIFVGPQ